MSRNRFDQMNCGVAQALEQVGDWWTLLIVRDAFFERKRFSEFEESLGIARNILSDRLKKLLECGVFERERVPGRGRQYEYSLTRKGRDLWLMLTAMRLWSDKWVFGEDKVPAIVRERGTGREVAALLAVDCDGELIDARQLEWVEGPGFTEGTPIGPSASRSLPSEP